MDTPFLHDVSPRDEHNQMLLRNVHPPDWTNPAPAGRYNLVVIGAGAAGLVTAAGAAGLGAKVALVERHLMGGDCLNVGCVPSKLLIAAARRAATARAARMMALDGTQPTLRQSPPRRCRSIKATFAPSPAAPAAVTSPAVPPPITTRL